MKDDSNAKLITVGVAALLIVIICGISFVAYAMNKKDKEDNSSRLQTEILNYASSTQEKESGQKAETEDAHGQEAEEEQEVQPGTVSEEDAEKAAEAPATKPEQSAGEAVVVEQTAQVEPADSAIRDNLGTTLKWQRDVSENLSQVEIDLPRQLSEMEGYWEAGNMDAVEDLACLPRYRAASEKLKGGTKFYYYGDTDSDNRPHGTGLASYADNQYYYGEWANGVRSGNGMWIKYYIYDKNAKAEDSLYLQHSYSGTWAGDLPNGEGAEHYDLIRENMKPEAWHNSNFIGTFKSGLYHGEMYITNFYGDGNTKEWSGTAKNGAFKALGEKDKKGQYPVIFEISNPDNYQWMAAKDNRNQGVDGLISAARKKQ